MEFMGPSAADFDNVASLNRGFLILLRRAPGRCLTGLRADLAERLRTLSAHEAERLAGAPFLLMSFRERDSRFWEVAFARHANPDLFGTGASGDVARLITGGLGFLWQLARHNPYAARLVSGAGLHWCEQLTELPFLHLSGFAALGDELLTLRAATDGELWSKLVSRGVSREEHVRRAAHISALQTVLTRPSLAAPRAWPAAACVTRAPSLQVADDG